MPCPKCGYETSETKAMSMSTRNHKFGRQQLTGFGDDDQDNDFGTTSYGRFIKKYKHSVLGVSPGFQRVSRLLKNISYLFSHIFFLDTGGYYGGYDDEDDPDYDDEDTDSSEEESEGET